MLVLLPIAGLSIMLFGSTKNPEINKLQSQPQPQAASDFGAGERQRELQAQLRELLAEQGKLSRSVTALNLALADMAVERDQLRAKLTQIEEKATAPTGTAMNTGIVDPGAQVAIAPIGLTILRDVPERGLRLDEIHFSPGSAELSPGASRKAEKAAELFLRQAAKPKLRLYGFSDSAGSDQGNLALSQRRAQAVAERLVRAGVARERIEFFGKGEQGAPIATANGIDEPLNRCVGIFAVD